MEQESGNQVVHIGYCDVKHNRRVGGSAKGNTVEQKREMML